MTLSELEMNLEQFWQQRLDEGTTLKRIYNMKYINQSLGVSIYIKQKVIVDLAHYGDLNRLLDS